ncbi:hypothetical protein P692DRAFT_20880087 [Suillus brevipes Sb2]|nr:hypothetical protein P692DRAFT_20880087 [Suillus brevipes Sb2]
MSSPITLLPLHVTLRCLPSYNTSGNTDARAKSSQSLSLNVYYTHCTFVLNSPTTADMTFITAGGAVSFYPDLTRNYHAVKTMTGEGVLQGQRLGSIGGDRFDIHPNMTFLNGPCNSLCPALWHHVSNHKEYAVVDWDRRFSVKSMLYNNDVEWRLNDYCFNSKCLFNIDAMAENEDIPPRIMPYSAQSVREQSRQK